MSWNRIENVEKIIKIYQTYDCVDEIIVWNNNSDFFISNFNLSKIKTINCDKDFGLNTRFVGSLLASQRCIIVHDDDLLASEANIRNLICSFEKDYTRIYTYEGRMLIDGKYTYEQQARIENVNSPTEATVSLTRMACFDKLYAAEYCKLSDVVFYDTDLNLNGEDIVLSYITSHLSGKLPIVLPLADPDGYTDLPIENYKISNKPNHLEHRSDLASRCEILFPTPKYLVQDNKVVLFGGGFYPFGCYKDSFTQNAEYKKILIKDDANGIKYMSLKTDSSYHWNIYHINTNILIQEENVLQIKAFSQKNDIVFDLQLGFLSKGEIQDTDKIRFVIKENFTSEYLISLKDYINCFEDCLLIDVKFILHSRNQSPAELCLTELTIKHGQ